MPLDEDEAFRNRAVRWVLVTGSRMLIAVCVLGVTFAVTLGLVRRNPAHITREHAVSNVFGSFLPGIISLITISLSVNQLILSRVFGSPGEFFDRLDETLSFRRQTERFARREGSPVDPVRFLELVEETIRDRANELRQYASDTDDEFTRYLDEIEDYCDRLQVEANQSDLMDIVVRTFGTRYAVELRRTNVQLHEQSDGLPSEAAADLQTIFDALKQVAVLRQFFKTIAIQRDLAVLSRRIGVLGFASVLVSTYMITRFDNVITLLSGWQIPILMSAAFVIVLSPVVVLIAHVMRLATISLHTLSVGPFVPPREADSD